MPIPPLSLHIDSAGYGTYADFDVETDWLPYTRIPQLNRAVLQNDLAETEHLLRARHNPNIFAVGEVPIESPIMVATQNGHHAIMALLLKHGADPEGAAQREWPLAVAVRQGDATAFDLLHQGGPKPTKRMAQFT